jgi:hypothetical protein
MAITKPDYIRDIVASLPIEDQERVLKFVPDLARAHLPPGTPGKNIVQRAKSFP